MKPWSRYLFDKLTSVESGELHIAYDQWFLYLMILSAQKAEITKDGLILEPYNQEKPDTAGGFPYRQSGHIKI